MRIGDLLIEVAGDRPCWSVTVWSMADGSKLLDEWYDVYYHARGDVWAEQRRSIQSLIELLSHAQMRVVEGPGYRFLGLSFGKTNILQHKQAEDWVQFNAFYDFFG